MLRRDRKLTKVDRAVMKYLQAEMNRLKVAHKSLSNETYPGIKKAQRRVKEFDRERRLLEIEAQYHNLSTVTCIVHEILATGRGV